jgi:hypothetical protein
MARHDGEGLVVLPGPPHLSRWRGILSTLYFDGVEDFEYYVLLRALVRSARANGLD